VRLSQARGDEEHKAHGSSRTGVTMLIGKGYSWKAARARLPPPRHVLNTARNPKLLLTFGLFTLLVLAWRSLGSAAGEVQRYVMSLRMQGSCLWLRPLHRDWERG